jgi:hypothetical protein
MPIGYNMGKPEEDGNDNIKIELAVIDLLMHFPIRHLSIPVS